MRARSSRRRRCVSICDRRVTPSQAMTRKSRQIIGSLNALLPLHRMLEIAPAFHGHEAKEPREAEHLVGVPRHTWARSIEGPWAVRNSGL